MRVPSGAPRLLAAVVAVLALLVGCGSADTDGPVGAGGPGEPEPSATGPAGGASAAAPPAASAGGAGGLGEPSPVVTGLAAPWGLAFLPDGRALVGERDSGRVLLVPAGGGTPVDILTLPVTHRSESGLLGLAISPHHETDGLVYAYYTSASDNRIARFRLDGARAGAVEDVLTGLRAAPNHNGGRIAFGPDGLLYAAVGDAGNPGAAQDPSSLNGKILRMTPEGAVPAGNPTPSSLVYSLGHRNVQGLAWDAGGRLWASEFGQNTFDEINLITPGANYGWPAVEGTGDTDGGRYTNPQVTWTTAEASPSGIAIRDDILHVAALRGERLWVVELADGRVTGEPKALLAGELGRLRTIVTAPDGGLWLTTSNTDGRGRPATGDDRIVSLR
ncbi:aldose sugar dehydrogenase [Frankia sp. Hr75.2]|nr:aldose sugar dehydrogenase [Frankia sp. Hr75.2]